MEDEEGKSLFHLIWCTRERTSTIKPCHARPRGTIIARERKRLSSHVRSRQHFSI